MSAPCECKIYSQQKELSHSKIHVSVNSCPNGFSLVSFESLTFVVFRKISIADETISSVSNLAVHSGSARGSSVLKQVFFEVAVIEWVCAC